MLVNQFGNKIPPAGEGGLYAKWDVNTKSAPINLSGNDLIATLPSGTISSEGVRSNGGKTTGKWYAEIVDGHGAVGSFGIGVCSQNFVTDTTYFSQSLESVAYYGENGDIYHNAAVVPNSNGANGQTIGIAVDVDSEVITFYRNGVLLNQSYNFSTMSDNPTLFLHVGGDAGGGGYTATLRTDPNDFVYTPPATYNAWTA